jgi:hypothetical protein
MEKKGKEKNKERRKGTDYLCTVGGQRGVGRIEERRPVTQSGPGRDNVVTGGGDGEELKTAFIVWPQFPFSDINRG